MKWFESLNNIVLTPFISAFIGTVLPLYFFKGKSRWEMAFNAYTNALTNLEKLKYVALQQSLHHDEIIDVALPSNIKTKEHLDH